uniref:Uncharacterized protein n=1 Tax=viral metagenome TaxID=1070528 RepID=A0A6M3LDW7_9ZZZZ
MRYCYECKFARRNSHAEHDIYGYECYRFPPHTEYNSVGFPRTRYPEVDATQQCAEYVISPIHRTRVAQEDMDRQATIDGKEER